MPNVFSGIVGEPADGEYDAHLVLTVTHSEGSTQEPLLGNIANVVAGVLDVVPKGYINAERVKIAWFQLNLVRSSWLRSRSLKESDRFRRKAIFDTLKRELYHGLGFYSACNRVLKALQIVDYCLHVKRAQGPTFEWCVDNLYLLHEMLKCLNGTTSHYGGPCFDPDVAYEVGREVKAIVSMVDGGIPNINPNVKTFWGDVSHFPLLPARGKTVSSDQSSSSRLAWERSSLEIGNPSPYGQYRHPRGKPSLSASRPKGIFEDIPPESRRRQEGRPVDPWEPTSRPSSQSQLGSLSPGVASPFSPASESAPGFSSFTTLPLAAPESKLQARFSSLGSSPPGDQS